jgi:hypothetical protein
MSKSRVYRKSLQFENPELNPLIRFTADRIRRQISNRKFNGADKKLGCCW